MSVANVTTKEIIKAVESVATHGAPDDGDASSEATTVGKLVLLAIPAVVLLFVLLSLVIVVALRSSVEGDDDDDDDEVDFPPRKVSSTARHPSFRHPAKQH